MKTEIFGKDIQAILAECGFETIPFDQLARQLADDGLDLERNRLSCDIALPDAGEIAELPSGGEERQRLYELGHAAIAAGQVGTIILNGGMATRFGGTAKGVVPAYNGRSFLDLKLSQVARASQGKSPALLMNSFATAQVTSRHLKELSLDLDVRQFSQMVSLRMTPSGDLYLDENGLPSLYAPGHGDLPFALARSGELRRFMDGGGRFLTVSNVDNLAAGLDPVVIGRHIDGRRPLTVELVATNPGDVGGFPAVVNGRTCIVEAFRIPSTFDPHSIPYFNTNTFVFDASFLTNDFELDWFAVLKKVDGAEVVQFERLMGQLSEFGDVTWLLVPREGSRSRFVPIKTVADLEEQAPALRAVLSQQGVL